MAEKNCGTCKKWSRKEPPAKMGRYGKMVSDRDSPLRRCLSFPNFFTLPNFICQRHEPKEPKP